jgi:WhiB family transcriptional regulator, redox-sensing transcriptional regulator
MRRNADWYDYAPCRGHLELFFDGSRADEAKSICRRCLVHERCLNEALSEPALQGIWGGLDERERHKLLRATRRAS